MDKACFQHDIACGYFKDLARRTASDKFLRDKPFNVIKTQKMTGVKEVLLYGLQNFWY